MSINKVYPCPYVDLIIGFPNYLYHNSAASVHGRFLRVEWDDSDLMIYLDLRVGVGFAVGSPVLPAPPELP